MSEHEPVDPLSLEAYLERQAAFDARSERVNLLQNELIVELTGRGVNFDITEQSEEVQDANLVAMVNWAAALKLAMQLEMAQGAVDGGTWDLAVDKKLMQAQYLTQGNGGPWLEVINKRLPGEPLDEIVDIDLIAEVEAARSASLQATTGRIAIAKGMFEAVYDVSSDEGEAEGESRDELATELLHDLARKYALQFEGDGGRPDQDWAEEVRVTLLRADIAVTPAWLEIINFMNPDDLDDDATDND